MTRQACKPCIEEAQEGSKGDKHRLWKNFVLGVFGEGGMGSKKSNDGKKKEKKESDSAGGAEDRRSKNGGKIVTDARFSSLHSDPRFQKVPKHKTKVEIDSRFNRMFHDKSFTSSSAPLDKRGKPKKDRSGNTLSHYYRLEEQEEEEKKKEISSEE
ncbi:unnamed protein product, partial [Vitis vinifera]